MSNLYLHSSFQFCLLVFVVPILFLRHVNFLSLVFTLLQYFCQSKQALLFQTCGYESISFAWVIKQPLMWHFVSTNMIYQRLIDSILPQLGTLPDSIHCRKRGKETQRGRLQLPGLEGKQNNSALYLSLHEQRWHFYTFLSPTSPPQFYPNFRTNFQTDPWFIFMPTCEQICACVQKRERNLS